MLEELRISSLGVIEESLLEVGPGLTVITGETGAGKTMVVTALGLLLGGRGDAAAVRTGARVTRVEGVLRVDGDNELESRARDLGGEIEDGTLLLARQVTAQGRSRAFVGGSAVPVGTLADLVGPLVAVHGQSDQHRLLQPAAQRDALDRFAGPETMHGAERFRETYDRLRRTEAKLAEVSRTVRERAREADLLRFGLAEVDRADPQPGEDAALAAEEDRLGFADSLRSAAEMAHQALSGDADGQADTPDALRLIGSARATLDGVREHDPRAAELGDRVAELGYLAGDLAGDLASYAAALDTDPAALAAVSARRAELLALTRKYGDTVDEVLAWAASARARLADLDSTDETVQTLSQERDRLRLDLAEVAAELSLQRRSAADRLARKVTDELGCLAMPDAALTVRVSQTDAEDGLGVDGRTLRFGPSGVDEVALLFTGNRGDDPRPLGKGASGGELSRLMLAVEVVLADTLPVPTFVFDEVDAGIGGKAAVEVGRRLAALARTAQVIVVTHLPQVAAFADQHVVVGKDNNGSVTSSGLRSLDDGGRVLELSRMLAGLEGSRTATAHAKELLGTARASRSG
jgi:DNA repair protein RecN (Recombination protein N)